MEKFTRQDLADAVDELATIPYFPNESRGAVLETLARMCPSRVALKWLTRQAVDHVRTWPGLAELRGILCSRYDAADGVDAYSSLPGYRAEDGERRSVEQHERLVSAGVQMAPESRELIALAVTKAKRLG